MRRTTTESKVRHGSLRIGLALVAWLLVGEALVPTSSVWGESLGKIVVTMQAAITAGPEVRRQVAGLQAESSEVLSGLSPGVPYLSWEREGIGGGFEAMPNSMDHFRISTPFNLPWRIRQNRDVKEFSEKVVDLGGRIAAVEAAGAAGRAWIDLAAATEKAQVAQVRVARLQKAVEIERLKYEVGEISGSEKTQLELQLARAAAFLAQSLAGRRMLEESVLAWTGAAFPQPTAGDLASLEEETAPPEAALEIGSETDVNLWVEEAGTRSELALLESKLARSTAWGRPEVDAEWQRVPEIDGIEGYDAFGFRIGIPLHLGKAGTRKVAASESRAMAAAAAEERTRLIFESRLATARAVLEANELILSTLGPTLEEMPKTEFSLSEQFRLGAIPYVVYLDGLTRLDDVRLQAIAARQGLLRARLELAELTGDESIFPNPGISRELPAAPAMASEQPESSKAPEEVEP